MTWQTIWVLDILDHKPDFFVRFSDHHWSTGPFDNRTQIYHLNTRLVRYSDGYCTCFESQFFCQFLPFLCRKIHMFCCPVFEIQLLDYSRKCSREITEHCFYSQSVLVFYLGAIIRGRSTCSTCQSFNLTYHEHSTCRHGYIALWYVHVPRTDHGKCTYHSYRYVHVLTRRHVPMYHVALHVPGPLLSTPFYLCHISLYCETKFRCWRDWFRTVA